MKRFRLFLLIIVVISRTPAIAQNQLPIFYSRAGANLTFASFNGNNGPLMFMPSLNITPGLRIIQGSDFALIATLPISWGKATNDFWLTYSEYGIDLPVMLEFNFGASTGNSKTSRTGITIGAGGGWLYMGEYPYIDNQNNARTESLEIWGYRFNLGYSFGRDPDGSRTMLMFNFGGSFFSNTRYTFSIGMYLIVGNRK
jgi:hypothetical protein